MNQIQKTIITTEIAKAVNAIIKNKSAIRLNL